MIVQVYHQARIGYLFDGLVEYLHGGLAVQVRIGFDQVIGNYIVIIEHLQ